MSDHTRVYRSSFLVCWRWTTGLCAGIALFFHAIALAQGIPQSVPSTITLALGMSLAMAVAVICFPVYVSAEGLPCYNFWGAYSIAPWSTISVVCPTNLFGLRYLRVRSTACSSELWVPLYLSKMSSFVASVREFAGETNPLVLSLAQQVQ